MVGRGLLVAVLLLALGSASVVSAQTGRPTVDEDLPATANEANRPVASNSPQLAVDPTDERFVAMAHRLDGPDFDCALELSSDGGRSWAPADPVTALPEGIDKCYAPEVGFDARGILYFLFVGLRAPNNVPKGVYLVASDDRGRTFSEPAPVLGPHSFGVRMAIDAERGEDGRIHVVWIAANREPSLGAFPPPPNPIMATHSDDGGRSWSQPVAVSDPARDRVVAPALALGPGGEVHVLYYDLLDDARDYQGLEGPTWEGHWALVLASSDDRGESFGPGRLVEDEVVPPERVMLVFTMAPAALAAAEGSIWVAWHDGRNGDWDVFVRRSVDGGSTWSSPQRLNDDPLSNGRYQYQPQLAVAPSGRVDAVFYDRRADEENVRNETAYAFSVDGGSFGPNRMLSTRPSDSRIGQRYVGPAAEGQVEFGSRLGLLSLEERAVTAWTDTRNSVRPVQQDIFTAVVRHDPPGAGSSAGLAWVGATAAIFFLAAVAIALGARRRSAGARS